VDLSIQNIKKNGGHLLNDGTIKIMKGDGRLGYRRSAPYDVIHVGAASSQRPDELIRQLKEGGRLIVPVGNESEQNMMQYDKLANGTVLTTKHFNVLYVPLTDEQKQLNS
ncbi:unnamed protein product, partial [Didymodactylos carnosus]